MAPATDRPTTPRLALAALLLGTAVFAVWTLAHFGGSGTDGVMTDGLNPALTTGAALLCLARVALAREERGAWLLVGLGLLASAAGDIATAAMNDDPPVPSIADVFYLSSYAALAVGLMAVAKHRVSGVSAALVLDAVAAALAVAGLAAALVFDLVAGSEGDALAVAVNLAYPVCDLALLAVLVSVIALGGWTLDRTLVLLAAGLGLWVVADGLFSYWSAAGSYVSGDPLDAVWPAAATLIAWAAWQPARRLRAPGGFREIALPVVFALVSIAVLVVDHFERVSVLALLLSAAALLVVIARMVLTFGAYLGMLDATRREAVTDALTALGNRRRLMRELEDEFAAPGGIGRQAIVIFDLDGFKAYNDTFGHLAGDQLLARLGARLRLAVGEGGRAYRLGGDEFCVVLPAREGSFEVGVAATAAALREQGDGFMITSSYGTVIVPDEAGEAERALLLADERMYAQKNSRRGSAGTQMRDVLLQTLREADPRLALHADGIGELALAVAQELELSGEDVDEAVRAAELHDVGKVAVPDVILSKPAPLDDKEWEFIRGHTIVAERILAAAPALRPIARIVRSSHERWDGIGYPDGLTGEEIPLAARIVHVCSAFVAMTSERPYAVARSEPAALEELRRCAGSQFDPAVVEAFAAARGRAAASATAPAEPAPVHQA
ncbi:MAG: diguanylate cyclase [Solirubrobacteraceae bacterium]